MTLSDKKCLPCEGIGQTLSSEQAGKMASQVPQWAVQSNQIEREFTWKDFPAALAFVNQVGAIAEAEGHHPDIYLHGWNKVRLTLSTHALGGLTENDFIVAAKIDQLVP